jgi:hypothetical protein
MIGDIRYAVRMLLKSPAFLVVAFLAIALAIGVNTTIFGVVNTLLLRPLPVGHSEELVQIYTQDARNGRAANSYLNYRDFAEENIVFTGIAAYQFVPIGFASGKETTNIFAQMVSGNYFSLLDVTPTLGRGFSPEEDSTPNAFPVTVLSHRFWKKIGADADIIGKPIEVNNIPVTVVGVLPRGFKLYLGPNVPVSANLDLFFPRAAGYDEGPTRSQTTIARLRHGVTREAAQAALDALTARVIAENPGNYGAGRVRLSVSTIDREVGSDARPALIAARARRGPRPREPRRRGRARRAASAGCRTLRRCPCVPRSEPGGSRDRARRCSRPPASRGRRSRSAPRP